MNITKTSIWKTEKSDLPIVVGPLIFGAVIYITNDGGPLLRFTLNNIEAFTKLLSLAELVGVKEWGSVTSFPKNTNLIMLMDPKDEDKYWTIYDKPYKYERYSGPIHQYALKLREEGIYGPYKDTIADPMAGRSAES